EELPLSLFVDLSGSMDWGTPNKAVTARRLAGAIAYVALAALDRVRLTVFADGPTSGGAPYRGRRAAAQLFARLQSFPVGGVTNYQRLVWPIARQRPGLSVVITDGLGDPPIDGALVALQRAQQEGAVLQLLAPQEIVPDCAGGGRPGIDDSRDRRAVLSENSPANPDRAGPAPLAQPDPRSPGQCALATLAPQLAALPAAPRRRGPGRRRIAAGPAGRRRPR